MAEQKGNKAEAGQVRIVEALAATGNLPVGRGGEKLSRLLAEGDEIREALAAGYSIKDVWTFLRDDGRVDLSYSLFSQYVRTKLHLQPRAGFEKLRVSPEDGGPEKPQLTAEQKRHNMLIHGNEEGIPQQS